MVATFNATLVAGTIPTISAMGTQVAATSTKLGNLGGAMASVISPWTLGIVALAGIAYAFDYFSKAHERAMKKIEDSNAKAVKSTEGWVSETKRVVELEKDLANAKGTDARVKAQERLDLSVKGLLAQYPDLAKYMVDEKGNHLSIAEAIDRRNQAELVSLRIELAKAELAERNLKSGIDLRKEWNEAGSKDTKTVSVVGGMGEQVEANNHEAAMRYNREQIAGTEKELGQQALKTKGLRDQLTILTALDQKEGSKHWGGNTVKDSATSKLNQDLEAYKLQIEKKSLEDGHYQEFTAEQEKAWLAAHINAYNLDAKEKAEVMRRIAGDERAVLKSSHEEEMRRLKTELESFRTSKEEQLRIAQVMEAKAANPKEAEEARKLQEKIRQDIIQRDKQVKEIQLDAERAHEVSLLELEEQHVTQMEQRGEIDKATAIRWTLAIEDSKYQIEVQSLKDRLKVAGLELPEREKIEAQLQALADKHRNKSDATKAQGPKSAAEDYKVGVGSTWLTAQKSMLSGAEGAFSGFFASLTQKGSTFGQKTKALWMDVSGSVVGALSKMAAQELVLWGIDKAKLAWAEIRSAWETKDTAKTLTQNAVKSTSNTGAAATGFFASFAGMGPWGYALAAAAILAMFALLGSVTGRKVGGLVGKNGPEMTMLGEEGLEVVAPIHDFKDWARDFQYAGANMGFNLARHDDKMSSLQAQASSYGTAALQNGGGMADKYVDNRGAMFVAADSRQWSDMVHQGFKYRAKSI
jgi:hypothetical protein